MKVLISGAGIAGPCLAYWLLRHGIEPLIVERAPALRTGGYVIDFWGAGFDVAERMGLVPELELKGYDVREIRQVDRAGRRVASIAGDALRRMTSGRAITIARSDLAASLHGALQGRVETIFDDSIVRLDDDGSQVHAFFERSAPRAFDLVVGADGLHSQVRRLVFGEEARFERYLGLKVAAFATTGYRPRDELVYVLYPEVGQQVARFAMRADQTLFLFTFEDPIPEIPPDLARQKAALRSRFEGSGWELPRMMHELDAADSVYFDRVSQIHLEKWTRGRVALVGDAAHCASLLAGQGSALAMVGAYVLAEELGRAGGDHATAFVAYERRLANFMAEKQKAAVRFTSFFAPGSRFGLFVRNQVMRMMGLPYISELAMGRQLADRIDLSRQ